MCTRECSLPNGSRYKCASKYMMRGETWACCLCECHEVERFSPDEHRNDAAERQDIIDHDRWRS